MPGTSPLLTAGKPTSFHITFNGSPLSDGLLVYKISTREEVNKIARAKIEIIGGDTSMNLFPESEENSFKPGTEVVISLGFDQTNAVVFSGIIVKHGISVKTGYQNAHYKNTVVLECADKAIKMTYQKNSEIFEKKTDSAIITSLITAPGVTKTITATTYTHPFLIQHEMTDWDFMLLRAKANGFVVFNTQGKLTVGKPIAAAGATSKSTLIYGENVAHFEGEIDATTQLQGAAAATFNPHTQAAVSQTASEPSGLPTQGDLTGSTLGAVASPAVLNLDYTSPMPATELKVYADALLVLSRIQRIRGEISFRGLNSLALGSIVTLQGFGSHFDGDTLISGIEHKMSDGVYVTKIQFGLHPNLIHGNPIPNEIPVYNPVKGLHIGKVTKIDADPDGQYKIQVLIPSLKQTGQGVWARLSHLYATAAAGSFFIPEVSSSVVVGFLNEDPRFPVVLGSLYNSTNTPPETISAENPKKAFYSKSLLKIEFDDKDKILTLLTPGGNSIIISDKDKGLTIKDLNGSQIKTSSSGIEITSDFNITIKSGQKVAINGTTGIDIACSGGDTGIKGLNVAAEAQIKASFKGTAQAELVASGQTVVKGGVVMIN
jgi:Rhs element Vgr protein